MDPFTFIIQNIQQGIPEAEIITQLQAAGFDDDIILEAFAEAYSELNLVATDQVIDLLARPHPRTPPPATSQADINRTKIIGAGIIFFGVTIMIAVIAFAISVRSDTVKSEPDSAGFMNMPMIPAPERQSPNPVALESDSYPKDREIVVPNMSRSTVPIAIELDYNEQDFTYKNACTVVRTMVSPSTLVSCVQTDTTYKYLYLKNNRTYCFDSTGNLDVPHLEATTDTENCVGEPFLKPTPVKPPQPMELEDYRYRALNYFDSRIDFEESSWMFGETLCVAELFTIDWYASFDILDVIVGIYQPGFGSQEIYTIGAFRATNNPEWIPGYGTFLWNVGVLRDGSTLRPGSGYRFIVQDADGNTKVESSSFSIAQCQ